MCKDEGVEIMAMNNSTACLSEAVTMTAKPWADQPPAPIAVSIPTAAKMLNLCHVTVRREIERGELKAIRIGRIWRIRVAELHAYLKRKES
jgi:excisionase family DNA binding protein